MHIKEEIQKLKKEKNAVILAHYYVPGEVQDVADFVGDSFALAKQAKSFDCKILLFAGVLFMAQSAKALNPARKVLIPDLQADCPMAHMASAETIAQMRKETDDLAVVCYVNSTTELKALSDVCVTSSNAVKIVSRLPQKNIFFIPDRHLASFVQQQLPDKNIIFNDGYCPIHHQMTAEDVKQAKTKHPQALVLVHPECPDEVLNMADYAGSTAGIIHYVKKSDHREFIIGTETGVMHELKKQNPDRAFYPLSDTMICPGMKKITLEKVYETLLHEDGEIVLDEEKRLKACRAMDRMLELAV